jgi:hypothetical protein
MNLRFLPLAALFCLPTLVLAQADAAHHRAVYAKINDNLKTYTKVKATHVEAELEFALIAWKDGSNVVRIDSSVPGEDGDGNEEYYLEDGKLLFAFRYYRAMSAEAGAKSTLVEDRFYFKDGSMFKWIGTDKKLVDAGGEDFKIEAERLITNTASFLAALQPDAPSSGKVQTAVGTFTSIEQGDYGHWQMTTETGKELSLFILQADSSVDKVLEKPESYAGKKCKVQWKRSKENIPEAGGDMDVDQILSVSWE